MKTLLRCTAFFLALMLLSGCTQNDTHPSDPSQPSTIPSSPTAPTTAGQIGWVTVDGNTYYFLRDGSCMKGKVHIGEKEYYFDAAGIMQTGWVEIDGKVFYFGTDGAMQTGWLELDGKHYYLNEDGSRHIGWLKLEESDYYFTSDGSMAVGQVEIDGRNHFFTAAGKEVLIVNPWNPVPDGYDPDLVALDRSFSKQGSQVSRVCHDALVQMITDCNKECPTVYVISSYRSYDYQAGLFENRIQRFQNEGYSREEAEKLAATVVAKPGTSEHHTGLAVDIIDTRSWDLTEVQETLPGQQWLMENCWRYGFILRYPKGTTDATGIIYEPWHYRYVGVELATELHNAKLTMEEYMATISTESWRAADCSTPACFLCGREFQRDFE